MTEEDALIDNSKCKDCEHLISRIVIPTDFEEFGISMEELQEEIDDADYDDDNEQIAIVHNTCLILNMDLGHVVVDCNKYCKSKAKGLLTNDPFNIG